MVDNWPTLRPVHAGVLSHISRIASHPKNTLTERVRLVYVSISCFISKTLVKWLNA